MAPPVSSASADASSVFARPVLCAVLDLPAIGNDPTRFARDLFCAGVDWIQLRDRDASAEALLHATRDLIAARDAAQHDRGESSGAGTAPFRVLVNKRVDIAIATNATSTGGADGVHLGGDALSPEHAARLLPQSAMRGASFHAENEISRMLAAGLTYGHLAPIWNPRSKPAERPALGLSRLQAAAALGLPLIAQGGLDANRAARAVSAGAAGIAVTGILTQAKDPLSVAWALRDALDRAAPKAS